MAAGPGGLKRLAKLYGMVESLQAMQVRSAAHALDEVERAALHLVATRHAEVCEGRRALEQGSRVESMAAERSSAVTEVRRAALAKMKAARRTEHALAVETHRASRVELRQIDGMVDRMQTAALSEVERFAQRVSDDRFLSRRVWTQAKNRERA